MLFAVEATSADVAQVIFDFWREFPADAEGRPYADEVVRAVTRQREELDGHIAGASKNWRLERMNRVDRNVLRIATWELLEQRDQPRAVLLDEAVELAKRFGTEDSGAFVNGVLTRVADELGRRDSPK
jgi:N utilization substance protein B